MPGTGTPSMSLRRVTGVQGSRRSIICGLPRCISGDQKWSDREWNQHSDAGCPSCRWQPNPLRHIAKPSFCILNETQREICMLQTGIQGPTTFCDGLIHFNLAELRDAEKREAMDEWKGAN